MGPESALLSVAGLVLFEAALTALIAMGGNTKPPEIVELETKLPHGLSHAVAVYDGDNSIYIIGGTLSRQETADTILRFDIISETIETLPHRIQTELAARAAVYNPDERAIYAFGHANNLANRSDFGIVKFTLGTSITDIESEEFVASTNGVRLTLPTGVWDPVRKIAFFLGRDFDGTFRSTNGIFGPTGFWRFDPYAKTEWSRFRPILEFPYHSYNVAMVYNRKDSRLYFLGGTGLKYNVTSVHPFRNTVTPVHSDTIGYIYPAVATIRGRVTFPDVVLPRKVGSPAFGWDEERDKAIVVENTWFMTFTPATKETSYVNLTQTFRSPIVTSACAYVPGLQRMYVFGGAMNEDPNRDVRFPTYPTSDRISRLQF